MSAKTIPTGFHPTNRHSGIFHDRVHDSYKNQGKPLEPSVCSECHAIFHAGRWQWGQAPENAHQTTCPACHRIRDHFPAGFLTMKGEFFRSHHDEIMQLVHNHEKYAGAEHPLKRIMEETDKDGETVVSTTDIHLARSMGEALHSSYQGELVFHYNPGQNLLRVNWTH